LLERGDGSRQLLRQVRVVGVLQQLVDRLGVVELALQVVVAIDLGLQSRELRGDLLRAGLIVPEVRVGRLLLELYDLRAFAVDVKGTPWRRGPVRRGS
jgi:hypothetical protein